ncbi:nanos homolog 3 [Pelodiscus sinensis]|uniref:nanos homolog 3 n=1 Tax=Pelodiscus sinensis TaxID=13735 RepID=UPI0003C44521
MQDFQMFDMWRDYLGLAKVVEEIQTQQNKGDKLQVTAVSEDEVDSSTDLSPVTLTGKSLCVFCKHNGESRNIYTAHNLKDKKGRVECPILRNYICPQCGATQDKAHTKRFCPLTQKGYTSVYNCSSRNSMGKLVKRPPSAPSERNKDDMSPLPSDF